MVATWILSQDNDGHYVMAFSKNGNFWWGQTLSALSQWTNLKAAPSAGKNFNATLWDGRATLTPTWADFVSAPVGLWKGPWGNPAGIIVIYDTFTS